MNGSSLTLSTTISGLPAGDSLTNIQLSYQTKWDQSGNSVTNVLAYSLNGGALINFDTNSVLGNSTWQTDGALLSGLQLQNGDTLVISDTFSGAAGNNGNLDFDNIQITSTTVVPEPSSRVLAGTGFSLAGLQFLHWRRNRCRTEYVDAAD